MAVALALIVGEPTRAGKSVGTAVCPRGADRERVNQVLKRNGARRWLPGGGFGIGQRHMLKLAVPVILPVALRTNGPRSAATLILLADKFTCR